MTGRRAARTLSAVSCAGLFAFVACHGRPEPTSPLALVPVPLERVQATLGTLHASPTGAFSIDDPKLRATIAGSGGRGVELEFRYLGATEQSAALRSGEARSQLGLELAARDTCNLVYVMWRLEPASELVVSVKQNEGSSRHAECENRGYRRLRPEVAAPVPRLAAAGVHRLRGELANGRLRVFVDGGLVWDGPLDAGALALAGKAGLRSDNVRFEALGLAADLLPDPAPS
jgi:hypothetical protein